MILTTARQCRALLKRSRTVALVGASKNPVRPSSTVFSYLRTQGRFEVTPINPAMTQLDGIKAYGSL
ncbi:MAG: CoA-binding protein, partial [Vulcanimicrobiaceae bacterium]